MNELHPLTQAIIAGKRKEVGVWCVLSSPIPESTHHSQTGRWLPRGDMRGQKTSPAREARPTNIVPVRSEVAGRRRKADGMTAGERAKGNRLA